MSGFSLFINRPVATSLLALAITLAGLLGLRLLPVAPLPQVDFPVIMVSASLPGASAETMAASVATPLERALGRIAGVNEMTSSSSLGTTRIILQFNLDRNIDGAARDVQAALNAAQSLLPSGMPSRPSYRKANPSDAPIAILTLTSTQYTQGDLYDLASTRLAQKIAQIDGVGDVSFGSANVRRPLGAVADDEHRWQVQSNDTLMKAQDYRPLIIRYRDGAPLRLQDVAQISDGVEDVRNAGMSNGQPAILIMIRRSADANIIETVDRLRSDLPALRALLPSGVSLDIAQERTPTIRASLREVEQSLAIAIGLVILVVFLFLRSARATLIPAVTVPV
ncbi:MAG: efflux RND transporter permease subunit, partial [Edwardsiella sp. (in: enterobacteria)]